MNLQYDLALTKLENKHIYDIDCYFYLLRKIPSCVEKNEVYSFFKQFHSEFIDLVCEKDWLAFFKEKIISLYKEYENENIRTFLENIYNHADKIKQKNKKSNGLDLVFLIEQQQENVPYLLNNDFIEENTTDFTEDNILKQIIYLKNNFGIKNVFYSNEISNKNLLKMLVYIKNTLEELSLNLEVDDFRDLGLKDKNIAIDLSDQSHFKNNVFYVGFDNDDSLIKVFFDYFYHCLWLKQDKKELKQNFIDSFWQHLLNNQPNKKEEKFYYIQLYAEYIDDCRNFILENGLSKNKELIFIDSMLESINFLLDQKEVLDLNEEKNIYFYSKWKEEFDKTLLDYNVNKMLNKNSDLKREMYKIAILFKYIVLNEYKMSYWKDILILEFLVDLSYRYLNQKDVEDFSVFEGFIFQNMKNKDFMKKFLNESQDIVFKHFLQNSYVGYINYYRENKSNFDKMKTPCIEQEVLIERFFWEENIDLVKEIIN